MGVIVPAILPESREDLENKLLRLHGLVDAVQIDIVDGHFAKPACWPYKDNPHPQSPAEDSLPYLGEIAYDMDLMVEDPEKIIGQWVQAGATRITIHAESSHQLPKLISTLQSTYGHDKDFAPDLLAFGLAINVSTDLALIEPYLGQCDYVQFMGIADIGKQGQPFDKRVLAKINEFRKKHGDVLIQVDGGVSLENAAPLIAAGVSRLIIGSHIWKAADVREEVKKFKALAQAYGMYS